MIPCQRTGCGGHYAPDGYCDECGHKASAVAEAHNILKTCAFDVGEYSGMPVDPPAFVQRKIKNAPTAE